MTKRLRLAIQKKGRLGSLIPVLLKKAGLQFETHENMLFASCESMPIDIIFIRHRDIIPFILQGQADLGIIGSDVYQEEKCSLPIVLPLAIAKSSLAIAVPHESSIKTSKDLNKKTIATTFPVLVQNYFGKRNLDVKTVRVSGSVEIAPRLGVADAVADLVGTGSTLKVNGLRIIDTILKTEAILISKENVNKSDTTLIAQLTQQLQSVIDAGRYSYVVFNLPEKFLPLVHQIFPGLSGPSIIPIEAKEPMVAVHLVVEKIVMWEKIHALQAIGATGIGVLPIENLLF